MSIVVFLTLLINQDVCYKHYCFCKYRSYWDYLL